MVGERGSYLLLVQPGHRVFRRKLEEPLFRQFNHANFSYGHGPSRQRRTDFRHALLVHCGSLAAHRLHIHRQRIAHASDSHIAQHEHSASKLHGHVHVVAWQRCYLFLAQRGNGHLRSSREEPLLRQFDNSHLGNRIRSSHERREDLCHALFVHRRSLAAHCLHLHDAVDLDNPSPRRSSLDACGEGQVTPSCGP